MLSSLTSVVLPLMVGTSRREHGRVPERNPKYDSPHGRDVYRFSAGAKAFGQYQLADNAASGLEAQAGMQELQAGSMSMQADLSDVNALTITVLR